MPLISKECKKLTERFIRTWGTHIRAINRETGQLSRFMGPNVKARSREEAQQWLNDHDLWCFEAGDMICAEIPTFDEIKFKPDWSKMVIFQTTTFHDN